MNWYHGSDRPPERFDENAGSSDGARMMFFSASCNVARRYGAQILQLSLPADDLPRISVEAWLNGDLLEDSFVIKADPESFDFPVDTLVLRQDPDQSFERLSREAIKGLDDGLAFREPVSRSDRQWQLFVEDVYHGDEAAWARDCQAPSDLSP